MGVTTQLWKQKQTPGSLLPVARKAWADFPMGAKTLFLVKHQLWKELLLWLFWGQSKEASSGRDQRREHLTGSCTNSGNLNASVYQRWFTSVHFAQSIVKDIAFICIDSLFHNMSLRYPHCYEDGKAWTSKTLTSARERLQRILVNPDKSRNVIKTWTLYFSIKEMVWKLWK